jgi:asparagine synthase (glutamine-hydrolysing)
MCDVIHHRGPDEEGFYVNGDIGLGIRRLKIIDLATGQQPIHNEDRSVWIVFNGEIYNYKELRVALQKKGHCFYTQTDTEVIVHLYEEQGDECANSLRGMFAFALWDVRSRRLLLARDRLGIKQLYYTINHGALYVGSEIKCLLSVPEIQRTIDPEAMAAYFRYLYIPGERTIFAGITRLPAGHRLICENGKVRRERFWSLNPAPLKNLREEEAVAVFREKFDEAVRIRLVSDVPLGAFLSGGIDSGAVVGVMAQYSSRPVQTFTIGYEEQEGVYDERKEARVIAERFGTDHHEFVVKPDVQEIIPAVIQAFDEPFADASAIPNYYISKLTRDHVTVALSGLGGDEIAAGYERYAGVLLAERYRLVPRAIREGLVAPLVRSLPDSARGAWWVDRAKRFVEGIDCEPAERYEQYVSAFAPDELQEFLHPIADGRDIFNGNGKVGEVGKTFRSLVGLDPLTQMLFTDLAVYIPDDLLLLTDRLSMAHSLEVRVPFLDHELIEYTATLPPELKLRGFTKKYLFKRAFADLLPRETLWRKKKGFSLPLSVWFRHHLRDYLTDWLAPSMVRRLGLFDEGVVARLLDEHLRGRHNYERQLWALLVFVIWHHLYVDS